MKSKAFKKSYLKWSKIHFFSYTYKYITKVALNKYCQFKNLLFKTLGMYLKIIVKTIPLNFMLALVTLKNVLLMNTKNV